MESWPLGHRHLKIDRVDPYWLELEVSGLFFLPHGRAAGDLILDSRVGSKFPKVFWRFHVSRPNNLHWCIRGRLTEVSRFENFDNLLAFLEPNLFDLAFYLRVLFIIESGLYEYHFSK